MTRVSSFDIFDTCLTRTFAYPIDLFQEVGAVAIKNGWIAMTPLEFSARRIAAETAARDLVHSREISLEQIYGQLGRDLELAPQIAEQIQDTEMALEEQALQPISETRLRITEARRQGRQILFLSDMYLPASFLRELLGRHEFYQEGDILYVSGEVGRGKGNGGLFQHARDLLKKDVTDWIHFGDNRRVDVEVPRRLGMEAEHFESGLLNRYELQMCPGVGFRHKLKSRIVRAARLGRIVKSSQLSHRRERWQSRLVASMRLARLAKPGDLSAQEKVIWDTGANLAGPLFYGYVKWVLAQAAVHRIPRLYFVARDGQILHRIAELFPSTPKNSPECRYLYGSRHAWMPASLSEIDASHLKWILAPTPGLCIRDVFSRLDILPETHRHLLESSGFPKGSWARSMTKAQVVQMTDILRNPALSSEINAVAAKKRDNLLHYLRGEGFFEQPEVGMVDLGWHGSLKQALAQVMEQAPDSEKPKVHGFYFALVRSKQKKEEGFSGYVNSLRPDLLGGFLFYMQLLEAFAAADHGQTLGYRQGQPILTQSDNPPVSRWGLSALQGGILAFCRTYGALDDGTAKPADYLTATLSALRLFYEKPTADEVKVWGTFPFSDQQFESGLSSLLPPWNRKQTLAALSTKDGRKRLWWAPAMAKREGMPSLHIYYRLQKLWRTRLKPGVK